MHRRDLLNLLSLSTLAGVAGCERPSASSRLAASSMQAISGSGLVPDVELVLTAAPDEVRCSQANPRGCGAFLAVCSKAQPTLYGFSPVRTLDQSSGYAAIRRFASASRTNSAKIRSFIGTDWTYLRAPTAIQSWSLLMVDEYVYDFEVTNRAGTYWYHPHPHMRTGAQVYQGLAGLLLVQDAEEEALALPSGSAELLCVLQDRRFDARNQLVFHGGGMMEMMNGFLGDRVLVNGQPQPVTEVDTAWHRVRLLNGSNARIYKLAWSGDAQMTVIGGDGGLLEHPLRQQALTLAPGQRADLLVDLTGIPAGTEVHLDSQAFAEDDAGAVGMMGMMGGRSKVPNGASLRVMTLRTRYRKGPAFRLPARLSSFDAAWFLQAEAKRRRVPLLFQRMEWLLDGRTFGMSDVAPEETVTAGSTHVWEFENLANRMGMQAAHPIHIHGRQFRVVDRTGGRAANTLRAGIVDAGWRDTVLVLPGETVRVQVEFTKHPGQYLYHCHILEHEDMGMMRNFRVT